jgi:hypothetical protein
MADKPYVFSGLSAFTSDTLQVIFCFLDIHIYSSSHLFDFHPRDCKGFVCSAHAGDTNAMRLDKKLTLVLTAVVTQACANFTFF